MSWLILIAAGCFEVVWAYCLKLSEGFTRLVPSVLFLVSLGVSMFLLGVATRTLPMSIAYPIWTGIGAVGAVLVGVLLLGEKLNFYSILFVSLIIVGILGLKAVQAPN